MKADNKTARIAGWMYLLTIGCGVYAELFARGRGATSTQPPFVPDMLFRSGLVADLAMLASYIVVTILFHTLFRAVSWRVSAIAAGFSLIGIAVLACDLFFLAIILRVPDWVQPASSGAEMVQLLLRAHGDGYRISLFFFGLYCLLLGWLIWRGRSMPGPVAVLVAAAGACNLVNSVIRLGAPQWAEYLPHYFTLPTLLGELALALWLLFFGVRAGPASMADRAPYHIGEEG